MQKPLTAASVYSNQYTAHSAVLGPTLQNSSQCNMEPERYHADDCLKYVLNFLAVNDKSPCVSNLAHMYPQILHRYYAALLRGISMTFFVVMFDHFLLARYQLLQNTLASPNFQYPCHTTPFHPLVA